MDVTHFDPEFTNDAACGTQGSTSDGGQGFAFTSHRGLVSCPACMHTARWLSDQPAAATPPPSTLDLAFGDLPVISGTSRERTYERVKFRLIDMPCCHFQLCWVNPRLPTFCPECGLLVHTVASIWEQSFIVKDDTAVLEVTRRA